MLKPHPASFNCKLLANSSAADAVPQLHSPSPLGARSLCLYPWRLLVVDLRVIKVSEASDPRGISVSGTALSPLEVELVVGTTGSYSDPAHDIS